MDVFAEEEFDTSLLTAARFSAPPGRIQRVGYVRDEHGCWTRVVVEYTRPMPAVFAPGPARRLQAARAAVHPPHQALDHEQRNRPRRRPRAIWQPRRRPDRGGGMTALSLDAGGLVEAIAARTSELLRAEFERAHSVEPWVSADEAAAHLGCSRKRLYDLASSGAVPCGRDGSRRYFRLSELDEYVTAHRSNGGGS